MRPEQIFNWNITMNDVDLVNIGTKKHDLKTDKQLESLEFYLTLTKKLISASGGNWSKRMLYNEDCIANIAHQLMLADICFNGKGNLYGYRKQRFQWALRGYLNRRTKNKKLDPVSLDQKIPDTDDLKRNMLIASNELTPQSQLMRKEAKFEVNKLLESGLITEQQKTYLKMYFGISPFVSNMSMDAIAKKHGVSKNNVFLVIHRALDSLRDYTDKKEYV